MNTITQEYAKKLIESSNGAIFSVKFIKKDGTLRDMVCRLGVTKHLKGGVKGYDAADFKLVTVFDMQKKGYRSISLDTLNTVTINGDTWGVV